MSADSQNPPMYVVLKEGETIGPLSEADFHAGVESGRFAPTDMVREEGSPVWTRIRKLTGKPIASSPASPPTTHHDNGKNNDAPALGWGGLTRAVGAKLRADAAEHPMRLGLIGIGVGLAALFLSQWAFVVWLPWLALAAAVGAVQLAGGRVLRGFFLLGLPVAISLFVLMHNVKAPPVQAEEPVLIADTRPAPPAPAVPKPAIPSDARIEPKTEPPPPLAAQPAPAPTTTAAAPPSTETAPASPPQVPGLGQPSDPAPSKPNIISQATDWWKAVLNPTPAPAPKTELASVALPTPKAELPPLKSSAEKSSGPTAPSGSTDLLQQHRNAFIVVKGSNGSGSGFVCRMDGATWLFTNVHVAAGIKNWRLTRLDGSQLQPGAAFAAGPRDAVRMALQGDLPGTFEAISNFDQNVTIGDQVEVLGNSEGAGVVTNLPGEVSGLGPDRIEVTSPFVPGNSGSPIIHVKTGKVIGIATYLSKRKVEFKDKKGANDDEWRRFGYRIDNVPRWETVVWAPFQAEAEQLRRIESLTSDLFGLLSRDHLSSTSGIETDALRRPTADWLAVMQRSHLSTADRATANNRFLSELRALVRNDVVAADAQLRYSYFRERLQRERQIRDSLYQDFDNELRRRTAPRL